MSKPGRNDPCPCGSGKKYKKCCELKESQRKILTAHKLEEPTPLAQKVSNLTHLFKSSLPQPPPEQSEEEKKPLDEPPTETP